MTDPKLQLCRVCLATNVKLFKIANTLLQPRFETLAGVKIQPNDAKSDLLCYICFAQLQKFDRYVDMTQRTDKFMTRLLRNCNFVVKDTQKALNSLKTKPYSLMVHKCPFVEIKAQKESDPFAECDPFKGCNFMPETEDASSRPTQDFDSDGESFTKLNEIERKETIIEKSMIQKTTGKRDATQIQKTNENRKIRILNYEVYLSKGTDNTLAASTNTFSASKTNDNLIIPSPDLLLKQSAPAELNEKRILNYEVNLSKGPDNNLAASTNTFSSSETNDNLIPSPDLLLKQSAPAELRDENAIPTRGNNFTYIIPPVSAKSLPVMGKKSTTLNNNHPEVQRKVQQKSIIKSQPHKKLPSIHVLYKCHECKQTVFNNEQMLRKHFNKLHWKSTEGKLPISGVHYTRIVCEPIIGNRNKMCQKKLSISLEKCKTTDSVTEVEKTPDDYSSPCYTVKQNDASEIINKKTTTTGTKANLDIKSNNTGIENQKITSKTDNLDESKNVRPGLTMSLSKIDKQTVCKTLRKLETPALLETIHHTPSDLNNSVDSTLRQCLERMRNKKLQDKSSIKCLLEKCKTTDAVTEVEKTPDNYSSPRYAVKQNDASEIINKKTTTTGPKANADIISYTTPNSRLGNQNDSEIENQEITLSKTDNLDEPKNVRPGLTMSLSKLDKQTVCKTLGKLETSAALETTYHTPSDVNNPVDNDSTLRECLERIRNETTLKKQINKQAIEFGKKTDLVRILREQLVTDLTTEYIEDEIDHIINSTDNPQEISTSTARYHCQGCGSMFNDIKLLEDHIKYLDPPLCCSMCDVKFRTKCFQKMHCHVVLKS